MIDIWIGTAYKKGQNGVHVLGESSYERDTQLVEYIPTWISKKQRDATFSRIFNGFSGTTTARASIPEREAFWASIAFYNFVPGSVGPTRKFRPARADFEAAQGPLAVLLKQCKPAGVFILGIEQARFSEPVVQSLSIPCVKTPHPASYGLRTQILTDAWNELRKKIHSH